MKLKRPFCQVSLMVILLIPIILSAQTYNIPESAVYDTANDRYLISNAGNGDILSAPRLNPENLSFLNQGDAMSIRGLTIVDNVLYAAGIGNDASEKLFAFDLTTGTIISTTTIVEGYFTNDVTADAAGNIYLSDSENIYKVDPSTGTYSIILANYGTNVLFMFNNGLNGLLFDEANNRLLYTDDTPLTGSQISAIDLVTNTSSVLITNPNFQWLDGLTVDHLGNYYVSSLSSGKIYRYDPNFTQALTTIALEGVNGVGNDIFYDKINNILVVPNMVANTVDFIPFAQLSTNDNETSIPNEFQIHQNFPNPFNPTTTIFYDISKESNVKITVFDLLGRDIVTLVDQIEPPGSRSIKWNGRDYTGNLVNAGVYVYQIEAEGFIQTKKMVLLK